MARVLLDLFCGRFGWSKAFAERGWKCVGVDLVEPPAVPSGCEFRYGDILAMTDRDIADIAPDFICASSPCEQFSVHGQRHFHKNPPYPELGIKLFNHTRALCEASGIPYVMENVRSAEAFVGTAAHHCGRSFYFWGNAVPLLLPRNLIKGQFSGWNYSGGAGRFGSKSPQRREATAMAATIPPEISNCVADYADALYAQRQEKIA